MSWEPLAASDPVPGEPGVIWNGASRLDLMAEALSVRAGEIKTIDPGALWVGLAAERFADHRDEVPPALESAAGRCHDAAAALRRYVPELEDAQELAAEALRLARSAEAEIDAATRGVDAMRSHGLDAAHDAEKWNAEHPDQAPRDPEPWSGQDWPAVLAGAEADLDAARRLLEEAIERRDSAARVAAEALDVARSDELADPWTTGAGWFGGILSRITGLAASSGPGELSFLVTGAGLMLNSEESWQHEALARAGIDGAAWDPSLGLALNDASARAAWELYAQLYAENPERFLWAGMAKLAGATFYAAFQDIHVLRRALEDGALTADQAADALERMFPGMPPEAIARLTSGGLGALAGELRFVETTFLRMQRNIFDDLAWQHLAYQQGGLAAMEALHRQRALDDVQIRAWRDIGSGDRQRVEQGNLELLRYEQDQVIGDDYDDIRDRSPVTWALTVGMSHIADSPIPGGRPFREVVPYEVNVRVDTPDRLPLVPDWAVPDRIPGTGVRVPGGGGIHLDTPDHVEGTLIELPLNNVSVFDRRWEWIERDMYPAYLDLVDRGGAGPLIATPIDELAADQRTIPDWLLHYEAER